MIWKVQIYHQHTVNGTVNGLYFKGQLSSQFSSWWAKNGLASEGPNGVPITTPSMCLYNILNIKYDFLVAKDRSGFLWSVFYLFYVNY